MNKLCVCAQGAATVRAGGCFGVSSPAVATVLPTLSADRHGSRASVGSLPARRISTLGGPTRKRGLGASMTLGSASPISLHHRGSVLAWRSPISSLCSPFNLKPLAHLPPSRFLVPRRGFFQVLNPFDVPLRKQHQVQRDIRLPREAVFDVVANVNEYPKFVPFCTKCQVTRQHGKNQLEAEMSVGFRVFTERYTSLIDMERPNRIVIQAKDSPNFKRLDSIWEFKPGSKEGTCRVDFCVDVEVRSRIHAKAIDLFFDDVAAAQMKAFETRALKVARARLAEQRAAQKDEDQRRQALETYQEEEEVQAEISKQEEEEDQQVQQAHARTREAAQLLQRVAKAASEMKKPDKAAGRRLASDAVEDEDEMQRLLAQYNRMSVEEIQRLKQCFEAHNTDGIMELRHFSQCCRELRGLFPIIEQLDDDEDLRVAVFTSFICEQEGEHMKGTCEAAINETLEDETSRSSTERRRRGPAPAGISQEEFLAGLYIMVSGSLEETAARIFNAIDSNGNGSIDRQELTTAVYKRIEVLGKVIPAMIRHQVHRTFEDIEKEKDFAKRREHALRLEQAAKSGLAVFDDVMAEVNAEVPVAVKEVFDEADVDLSGDINFEEWTNACRAHPTIIELLSVDRLAKIVQWASAITKSTGAED